MKRMLRWALLRTMRCRTLALAAVCVVTSQAWAVERGTFIRTENVYVSPDATSAKLVAADRGREGVVLERGAPGWLHVIVTLMDAAYSPDPEASHERNVTGWVLAKGFVTEATAKGDEIVFGEAADSEDQASQSHGRKGAADDARRLYYRVYDLFPKSPLAGEALYRAADIQWQLDREDMRSRKSYRTTAPGDRLPINEDAMRLVHKKFPGTKWADLAAYSMLDNKLCGDWGGASKCPEKEAEVYEKYASEHPNSPKAAEAYYEAAYRWAAAVTIYSGEGQTKKQPEAQKKALADAAKVLEKNASPEWNARAQRLIYVVNQGVPLYGTLVE